MAKGDTVEQSVDLKKEQRASRARPHYRYSVTARLFFGAMDVLAGAETTLAKVRLLEALAPIPYRAWENQQHARMALRYDDKELVERGSALVRWGREAQDNEYWHLLVVHEKLREESGREPRYMMRPLPYLMVASYALMMRTMARVDLRRSFLLNAEFEDHSEHVYAELVDHHPEWETQPVTSGLVQQYGAFDSWADVFRRIGLDERNHMNNSFTFAGRPECVVTYQGMPASEEARPLAA